MGENNQAINGGVVGVARVAKAKLVKNRDGEVVACNLACEFAFSDGPEFIELKAVNGHETAVYKAFEGDGKYRLHFELAKANGSMSDGGKYPLVAVKVSGLTKV